MRMATKWIGLLMISSDARESVAYFDLTPISLLERVKFKEKDQQPFVTILCERLGMKSPRENIAPHL